MATIFCKGSDGHIDYTVVADTAITPTGCWKATEADLGGQVPSVWVQDKIWDDALGRPRALTQQEIVLRAKEAKRSELENAFANANRQNFPERPDTPATNSLWVFLGVYSTNQNDSRIVAFKSYKNNLDIKIGQLDKLGTQGNNPPLTLEEIAKIVW